MYEFRKLPGGLIRDRLTGVLDVQIRLQSPGYAADFAEYITLERQQLMLSLQKIVDPAAKPLKLGIAAFLVGLCGVAFGFVIDYGLNEPLSFVALGVVVLAVAIAFFAVVWGCFAISRNPRKRNR